MIEHRFEDQASLNAALAGEIAERLSLAVVERDRASLVVTGGSTPGGLYDVLGGLDAPWERVWITLSDERWVDPDDAASNEHLIRQRLLKGHAARAHLVPLKTVHRTPAEAAPTVHANLSGLPRPFDVVLLGMGCDGHIASLFPRSPALQVDGALDVVAVEEPAAAGSPHRLSLTLSALADARWTGLIITGADKLTKARTLDGAPVQMLFDTARSPVEVFWTS